MKIGFKNFFLNFEKNTLLLILGLAQKNYFFAKSYYIYKRRREMKRLGGSPIILFQMGKVGSKTIRKSLEALNLNMPVYHSHLLTKKRIADTEQKRKKFFRTSRQSYLQRPWLNLFLRKQIDEGLDGKKWKIITPTREPIAPNIATFFENLEVRQISATNDIDGILTGNPGLILAIQEEKTFTDRLISPEIRVLNRQAVLFWNELKVTKIFLPSYLETGEIESLASEMKDTDFFVTIFRLFLKKGNIVIVNFIIISGYFNASPTANAFF